MSDFIIIIMVVRVAEESYWLSAWLKCPIGLGRGWIDGHHYCDYELTIVFLIYIYIYIYPAWLKYLSICWDTIHSVICFGFRTSFKPLRSNNQMMDGNLFPQRSLAHDYWQAAALMLGKTAGEPSSPFGWPCCPC